MFMFLRTLNLWYNSTMKPILPLLLLVCAPLAGLAVETFALGRFL